MDSLRLLFVRLTPDSNAKRGLSTQWHLFLSLLFLTALCLPPLLCVWRVFSEKYAEQLVAKGIKIGQVDQTETPDEMKAWNKLHPKQRRDVVNRQLSEVLTPGTLVDSDVLKSADANYLFAMTERLIDETEQAEIAAEFERHKSQLKTEAEARTEAAGTVSGSHANPSAEEEHNIFVVEFGFCYVDCTTGKFVIGQRRDDQQRSFLKTLLGQVAPRETIFPAGGLSPVTQAVLRLELPQNTMKNEKTFSAADKVVAEFNKKKYFAVTAAKAEPSSQGSSSSAAAGPASQSKYPGWPKALQLVLASNQSLAISALGAIESYLERTHHAHELISLSHFLCYLDEVSTRRCLVLDGQTLTNLEIIKNEQGQSTTRNEAGMRDQSRATLTLSVRVAVLCRRSEGHFARVCGSLHHSVRQAHAQEVAHTAALPNLKHRRTTRRSPIPHESAGQATRTLEGKQIPLVLSSCSHSFRFVVARCFFSLRFWTSFAATSRVFPILSASSVAFMRTVRRRAST